MNKADKTAFWQRHIEAWTQSGLTQRIYCEQHHLKLANFSYWRKRQAPPHTSSKLIPLSGGALGTTIELTVSGLQLSVPISVFDQVLPVVLRTLHEQRL
jgi:hypothetical protein